MADNVQPRERRRYSAPRSGLAVQFAHRVGISTLHGEQLLWGNGNLRDRVLEWVRTCQAAGRLDVLTRWFEKIDRTRELFGCRTQLTPALELAGQKAECKVDETRTSYLVHETRQEAIDRVRAIREDIKELTQLEAALCAKYSL